MFNQYFTAGEIAEPLVAVSAGEADRVRSYFDEKNFDVIGFRKDGEAVGFLEKGNIADWEDLQGSVVPFKVSDLITQNTELLDSLGMLQSRPHLFVIDRSEVGRIITSADVQKPAVRMLFFGVVTVFENRLAELIDFAYPDNGWADSLKEKRLGMAQAMFGNLRTKNQETNLIACTQFADKTGIVLDDAALLLEHVGLSKTKAGELFNRVRRLRDDLAHAQSLAGWFENYDPVGMIRKLQAIIASIDRTLEGSERNSLR